MIACKPGDIVLVRFPFTDLSAAKQRPALVVSPAEYAARHGDVVVLALTSRPQPDDTTAIDCWRGRLYDRRQKVMRNVVERISVYVSMYPNMLQCFNSSGFSD